MLGKKKNVVAAPKVLDVDASLQGNLAFKDPVNLRINGNFEGNLDTRGELFIGVNAIVNANILGERIVVAGTVAGDITALSEIRLLASARVTGNIKTPALSLEKGCIFHGHSKMLAETELSVNGNGRKVFLDIDEVAHYLSVEKNLVSEWAETGKLPANREGENWRFDKHRVDEWITNGRVTA